MRYNIGSFMRTDIYINAASNECIVMLRTVGWPNCGLKDLKPAYGWRYLRGIVTAVLPGLQAAFVDIGQSA